MNPPGQPASEQVSDPSGNGTSPITGTPGGVNAPDMTLDYSAADPYATRAPDTSPRVPDLTYTFHRGDAPEMPSADWPAVAGYEILDVLGRGGMGVVYKARQIGLNRLVALKMILGGGHAGADHIARFKAEAEAVARLRHPNIVQIHEIGETGGHPYFCLEFVEGGSLAAKLAGMPEPPRRAAQLIQTLAEAVEAAHRASVIHRDLKPANVLLTADGQPKITDFGLAKQMDSDSGQTQSGSILGTPSYMAPEQAAGKTREVGATADAYALGAILYEALTGRPPFRGASMLDTLEQVRSQEPVPPKQLQPSVPLDLETICLKCLRKEPGRRYGSAAALADDLGRFLAGEPILARPVSRPERAWRWCKRNPGRAAMIAGLFTTVLTTIIVLFGAFVSVSSANRQLAIENTERKKAEETAKSNERIALEQADLALQAIGDMIFEVQQELEDTPGAREAQLSIMRKATKELNRLVNMPATTDKYLRRHALAHLQLGRLSWQSGDLPKAHEEFELSMGFGEKAVAANPASDKAHYNRAAIRMEFGRSFEYQFKQLDEAKKQYEAANQELADLCVRLRDFPDGDPKLPEAERVNLRDTEDLLSQIYDLLGRMHYSESDPKQRDLVMATKWIQQSLDIRERLLAAKADHNIRSLLALSYTFLAEIAQFKGNAEEAANIHAKIVEQREAVLKERRSSILARRALGGALMNYGDALCYADRYDKALEQYRAALPLVEQVWLSQPDNLHNRNQVAQAHYCIGCVTVMTDRKLAMKHFAEAVKHREENLRVAQAKKAVTRMEYNALMLTLAWYGQHERAAKMAQEIEKVMGKLNPKELAEDVGATYGICRAAVGADKKPEDLTAEEKELRDHYLAWALDVLGQAVDRGYDGLYYLERDPDFQPLRGVPEYEKLLDRLRKAKK